MTHLHLILNHYPVIGTIIGAALLAFALVRKSNEVGKVALALFAVLGAISVVVYLTGESAEHAVESLPDFSEAITERHEEFAKFATIVLATFSAASLVALVAYRNKVLPRIVLIGSFVASLFAAGAMGYTGKTGGEIRHTEILDGAVAQTGELP